MSPGCVLEKCSVILDPWIQALDPIDDDLVNPLIPREIEFSNSAPNATLDFELLDVVFLCFRQLGMVRPIWWWRTAKEYEKVPQNQLGKSA